MSFHLSLDPEPPDVVRIATAAVTLLREQADALEQVMGRTDIVDLIHVLADDLEADAIACCIKADSAR